jgi:dTDP-alpha-D-glucose dehydrogenase
MNITIIGFGYIGSVISAVMCEAGHNVNAIEQNPTVIKNIKNRVFNIPEPALEEMVFEALDSKMLTISDSYDQVASADAILVTVGTPLSEEYDADLSALEGVFLELSSRVSSNQIVMIKSTVPPGVTRMLQHKFFPEKSNILMAFSPERLAEGNAISQLKELPIIVGGINEESTLACSKFWEETLACEVIPVSSPEAAELVKLADNQWIDLNIALANELALLCDSLDFDVDILEIIKAANTLKKGSHYVNILTPSIGVGGYCLTKDPWFIHSLAQKNSLNLKLPSAARKANDLMPLHASQKIIDFLKKNHQDHLNKKIAILGYSFKTNSGDTRFTPMKFFIDSLIDEGFKNIFIFDSTVKEDRYESPIITWTENYSDCINNSDILVFGAAHNDIKDISIKEISSKMNPNGMVYDGRIYLSYNEIRMLKSHGINYLGVGRSF